MNTESKTVEEIRSKVEKYLRQMELNYEVKSNGTFWVRQGSTAVILNPVQWGDNDQTLVKLLAPVAMDATNISPKLTHFLAEKNNELLFGKFSLDSKNKSIWYEHVLLGDFLDKEELFTAITAVALTADEFDEQIAEMCGGKRMVDF